MILGQCCFASYIGLFLFFSIEQLGNAFALVTIMILHGVGRFTFESVLKSIVSDFWREKEQPYAFANIVVANGTLTVLCFFSFPHLDLQIICIFGVFVALLG